jgi:dipeptidyl aminopeptidase/acylaminoacyl peptidase
VKVFSARRTVAWLGLALLGGLIAVHATLPPLIPRDVLFGNPERVPPTISPDGRYLAYLRPDSSDVLQVWVRTIGQTDDHPITRDPKRGIWQYIWTYDGRHLLYLQDSDGDENYHIYATDLSNNETRDLTPIQGVAAELLATDPGRPNDLRITMNRRNPALFEPWQVDLTTGALTLLAENPGEIRAWLPDADLVIRGAQAGRPDGGGEFRVRHTPDGAWRVIATWAQIDTFQPVSFSRDGKTIYVQTTLDAETRGLYALDAATGRMTHKVLDASIESDFATLGRAAPGDLDLANRDLAGRTWVVSFTGDVSGIRYALWDRSAKTLSPLFDAMPRLAQYTLAPVEPIELRSRDGLSLPSYFTLPVGVPAQGLPLVLLVHGGPWWRDAWGFGKRFAAAARKQFAAQMHDDLIDGVNWAIARGIADPKRVGIMGTSYGGYATLVGLSFTPEVFACGVDAVGPSNLVTLVESFPAYWKPFLSSRWYPYVGDPSDPKDRADMLSRSPITHVDRIRAPMLVGQGANDPRVKPEESETIVAALRQRGIDVQYLVFPDEGHGFLRPENRITWYTAAEAFLTMHLGGRAEAAGGGP